MKDNKMKKFSNIRTHKPQTTYTTLYLRMVEPLDSDPPLNSILSNSDVRHSATGLLVNIVINVTTTFYFVFIFEPHLDASLSTASGNLSM